MSLSVEITNLDKIDLPEVVYKYRFWDDAHPRHKTILTRQEMFFASPMGFEDPIDCKNLTRYDLVTDAEIYAYFLNHSFHVNETFNAKEHEAFARHHFGESPMRDKDFVKKKMEDDFKVLCNRLGVLSLTEKNNLAEMWEKYAGDHTGICVGFEARSTFRFFGGGSKVDYYETLPTIYPRPKHSFKEQITLQVYSKEKKWEFEREYRAIKLFQVAVASNDNRTIAVPKMAIREVIFGAMMGEETVRELEGLIASELPHVQIRRAVKEGHGGIAIP